ncbi:Phosphoadenosine phosphosulfate [Cyphellophora attinorum]|uniref:phosphoadenylyl-sulfate reductase (thioredoxin) n=1 Tax=Cyphellophora attinorum TaxID=1664694 RepID=A0A0N1H917_9EURO|nr:Phosphoadenosine phosphosulfate [Phialophora attinorum]KPI43742.1 Phosphoadenosine phosphosulfate [Phialophora attinorum]
MVNLSSMLPLIPFSVQSFFNIAPSSPSPSPQQADKMSRPSTPAPIDTSCESGRSTPLSKTADSGYGSAAASEIDLPEVYFTKPHLQFINRQLQNLEPQEILRWCVTTLPHLFQTTAFGLTGLVTLDMLSKMDIPRPQMVDMIFLDTLYHFSETLDLIDRIRARYPNNNVHIFKPVGAETEAEFAAVYGDRLWETDGERYDYLVKVEPGQRANRQLNVQAVLTGRRRSQGGKRGDLPIIEVDEDGTIKVNPLANWSFKQVKEYIDANSVPYNALLDQGYKSVGDWHSTQPVADGEDERAGRWKGQEKTECGLHNPKSKYALFLMEQEKKREQEVLHEALKRVDLKS